jgi:hypothetical protein
MKAWIPLRAMCLVYDHEVADGAPRRSYGVCLPDGRFILFSHGRAAIATFSSEATLLRLNPGVRLEWTPKADATINHVMPEDD